MGPDDRYDRKLSAEGSLAFVVRFRREASSQASRPRFEIEDVEVGDKRRFMTFDEAVAHMRSRIDAFVKRTEAGIGRNTPQ